MDTTACICFHCSQTLDNFHSFATKIKAIQKILFPEQQQVQIEEIAYEFCVIPGTDTHELIKPDTQEKEIIAEPQEIELQFERIEETEEPEAVKSFPSKLLENGSLLYKGEELYKMMTKFYNATCETCAKTFKSITELFRHQKEAHSSPPTVLCCSTQLRNLPGIVWHFVRHIQPEAFKCHICSYSVSRPKFLKRHLQIHADPSEKQFSCDKCDKRFIWKGALRTHLDNHKPESERKGFVCEICLEAGVVKRYQTTGSLSWHKKSHFAQPSDRSKNLCEICSKTFATLTSFKEHMLTHSEDCEKLQLRCEKCGKWLKNQRCLKSHMLLHADVDHKCNLCDYTTKKEHLLRNHIITKHTEERKFKCDECDKTFKVKRALTVHKAQSHTGEVKTGRTCEFCSKTFGSSTNYYTHRKNLHAAELSKKLAEKDEEKKRKRIQIGLENPS